MIAQIVGLTVLECYGVVGMAASSLTQGVYRLLSRERVDQGVTVRHEPAGLVIELYIVVEYGLNLAEVAGNVRSRVQYQVEKLTQMPVDSIQILSKGSSARGDPQTVNTPRQIALAAGRGGAAALEASRSQLNDLNVFPVPDGDTGSNLWRTAVRVADGVEAGCRAVAAGGGRFCQALGAGWGKRKQRDHPVPDRGRIRRCAG